MKKLKKLGVISLGCDKNRVDTEKALGFLKDQVVLVNDQSQAEIIIVNTCAFLKTAREEAIEEVLLLEDLKKSGSLEKIILTGCLPQLYKKELYLELDFVDAFLGVSDYEKLPQVIERIYNGERVIEIGEPKNYASCQRVLTTEGYAYLKIADGCSKHCTYCLIPSIRGKYRSIPIEELVEEARSLGELKELILVAQDVTAYGKDFNNGTNLVTLIKKLSNLDNILGIRLLYCYPEGITDELIHELSVNAKMIRYLDIPMQHASDSVLKRMARRGTYREYLDLIYKLKERVKGISIRSTFIAGFPGETEEDFNTLLQFINNAKLNSVGFFKYSKEEGTPAFKLNGHLLEKVKNYRLKKLYSAQKKISLQLNKGLVGKTFSVTCEGFSFDTLTYYGRAYFSAPDIDGKIFFFSDEEVLKGQTVNVKITKAESYDLFGEKV